MSKDKRQPQQQKLPESEDVKRLAVSISKGVDGEYTIEELQLLGNEVVYSEALVSKPGLRVASGEMLLSLEERLPRWQREGLLR